jgi:protein required for attachment to host cells
MIHAIVADTRRLRVFEAVVDRAPLELAVFANPAGGKPERELVSDRPGRVINTASGAHQALQGHTPAGEHALQLWLKGLARPIRELLEARDSTGLILFASPRLLPMLRDALPASVQSLVHEEMTLDLAGQPGATLRKRIEPTVRAAEKALARPEVSSRSHRVRKRSARVPTM